MAHGRLRPLSGYTKGRTHDPYHTPGTGPFIASKGPARTSKVGSASGAPISHRITTWGCGCVPPLGPDSWLWGHTLVLTAASSIRINRTTCPNNPAPSPIGEQPGWGPRYRIQATGLRLLGSSRPRFQLRSHATGPLPPYHKGPPLSTQAGEISSTRQLLFLGKSPPALGQASLSSPHLKLQETPTENPGLPVHRDPAAGFRASLG